MRSGADFVQYGPTAPTHTLEEVKRMNKDVKFSDPTVVQRANSLVNEILQKHGVDPKNQDSMKQVTDAMAGSNAPLTEQGNILDANVRGTEMLQTENTPPQIPIYNTPTQTPAPVTMPLVTVSPVPTYQTAPPPVTAPVAPIQAVPQVQAPPVQQAPAQPAQTQQPPPQLMNNGVLYNFSGYGSDGRPVYKQAVSSIAPIQQYQQPPPTQPVAQKTGWVKNFLNTSRIVRGR